MRDDENCPPPQNDDGDTPREAARKNEHAERTANGRFARGFCPNPRGRPPRKRDATATDVFASILSEKIPRAGSSEQMSVLEAMTRSLCAQGMREPSVGLALMKLAISSSQAAKPLEGPSEEMEASNEVLNRYVEREIRRRSLRGGADDDPEKKEEGS